MSVPETQVSLIIIHIGIWVWRTPKQRAKTPAH